MKRAAIARTVALTSSCQEAPTMFQRFVLSACVLALAAAVLLAPADTRGAAADGSKRTKWEYRYVTGLTTSELMALAKRGQSAHKRDLQLALKNLNAAGAEGWSVVALMGNGHLMARERP